MSSAAQYFHLLRRQASIVNTKDARPLVLMAPKSMIRNPYVASPASLLSEGSFQTVLEQPGLGQNPARVERLVLCTGKVAIDLAEELDKTADVNRDWLHIVRVEQLYPFPKQELKAIIDRFLTSPKFCGFRKSRKIWAHGVTWSLAFASSSKRRKRPSVTTDALNAPAQRAVTSKFTLSSNNSLSIKLCFRKRNPQLNPGGNSNA